MSSGNDISIAVQVGYLRSAPKHYPRPWIVANGVFDLLHAGHVRLLRAAKECRGGAGTLIVLVDSDECAAAIKPGRPIIPLAERIEVIRALRPVDFAAAFKDQRELAAWMRELEPDVIVKGSEYRGRQVVGAEHARKVLLVEPQPGSPRTTDIVQRIRSNKE